MQTYKKKSNCLKLFAKRFDYNKRIARNKIIKNKREYKINPNTTRVLGSTIEYTEL